MRNPAMTDEPCTFHRQHLPEPHINHRHHVWPLGDGGPDTAENRVVICPTGHANVHDLLTQYRLHAGVVSYSVTRRYSRAERALAKTGWERICRRAM